MATVSLDADEVRRVRENYGCGMSDAKRALVACEGLPGVLDWFFEWHGRAVVLRPSFDEQLKARIEAERARLDPAAQVIQLEPKDG